MAIYIHVDEAAKPGEKGERATVKDDKPICPKCGSGVECGFGLAYGGYGPYEFCADDCGWYWKKILADDEG